MSDTLKEKLFNRVESSFGTIGFIVLFLIATIVAAACVGAMLWYLPWWLKFLAVVPFAIWGYFCSDQNLLEVVVASIIVAILLMLLIPAVRSAREAHLENQQKKLREKQRESQTTLEERAATVPMLAIRFAILPDGNIDDCWAFAPRSIHLAEQDGYYRFR